MSFFWYMKERIGKLKSQQNNPTDFLNIKKCPKGRFFFIYEYFANISGIF